VVVTSISLGLRRRAFKNHEDWQSIVEGKDYHIEWDPAFLKKPFFVASGPKGIGFDYDNPMCNQSSQDFMCTQAKRCGLGGAIMSWSGARDH
jgi:hypothetical protein